MKNFVLYLLAFSLFLFVSNVTLAQGTCPDDAYQWSDISTIFQNSGCAATGCHGGGAGGLDLTTHSGFRAGGTKCDTEILSGTTLVDIIVNGGVSCTNGTVMQPMNAFLSMPLTQAETDAIQAWVNLGAYENCRGVPENDGLCTPASTMDMLATPAQTSICADGSNAPVFAVPSTSLPDVEIFIEVNSMFQDISPDGSFDTSALVAGDEVCYTAFAVDLAAVNELLNTASGICVPLDCDALFGVPGLEVAIADFVSGANDGTPGLNNVAEALAFAGSLSSTITTVQGGVTILKGLNEAIGAFNLGPVCFATSNNVCLMVEDCVSTNTCPTVILNDDNLPTLSDALCVNDLLSLCFDINIDEATYDLSLVEFNYNLTLNGVPSNIILENAYTSGTNSDPNATGQVCFEAVIPAGSDPCSPYTLELEILSVFYNDPDCPNSAVAFDLNISNPVPLMQSGEDLNVLVPLLSLGGLNPITVEVYPNPNWTANIVELPACDGSTAATIEILAADGATVCETLTIGTAGADGCPPVDGVLPETIYEEFATFTDDEGVEQTNPCAVSITIPGQTIACEDQCISCPSVVNVIPPTDICPDATTATFCVEFDIMLDASTVLTVEGVAQDGSAGGTQICVDLPVTAPFDPCNEAALNFAATAICDGTDLLADITWSSTQILAITDAACGGVAGCTDSSACNYNPNAACDDNSCLPTPTCNTDICLGDTEIIDPNDACSCIVDEAQVSGCTDASACNFNTAANCEDNSCDFGNVACADPCNPIEGCMDATACNYDAMACVDDGSCEPAPCNPGCTDPCAANYDQTADADDGSCVPYDATCNTDCSLGSFGGTWDATTCSCINEITPINGCTDASACNYNAAANCNDNSCDFGNAACADPCNPIEGCMDATACNYDAMACVDDGSCEPAPCNPGCTDPCAANYDPSADADDGSCVPYDDTCNTDCSLGSFGGTWDTATCSCINEITPINGCTDVSACNYNAAANCDDGSCDAGNTACTDPCNEPDPNDGCDLTDDSFDAATCTVSNIPNCPTGTSFDAGNCACITDVVDGCLDPCDPAYNPASTNNNLCMGYSTTCNTDCTAGDLEIWDAATCACVVDVVVVTGCIDATACNYNAAANCDDNNCDFGNTACTDPCNEPNPNDGCDLTADSFDAATCTVSNTPNCPTGTSFDAANCACITDAVDGCLDTCDPAYNPASTNNNLCMGYSTDCNTDCTAGDLEVWDASSCACVVDVVVVAGCTEPTACNYNAAANCDDDSCDAGNTACTDPCNEPDPNDGCDLTDDSFDAATCTVSNTPNCPTGTSFDAGNCACITDVVDGCLDPCDPAYNPASTNNNLCAGYSTDCNTDCTAGNLEVWDASSCACVVDVVSVSGCTDVTACNYNNSANCDDNNSCDFGNTACAEPCIPVEGCMDATACNYDAMACEDDGSCTYAPCSPGCTDACADNYNPNADEDDGSCNAYDDSCPDDTCTTFFTWNAEICSCTTAVIDYTCNDDNECTNDFLDETTCDCVNEPIENCGEVLGCTDACASNYNPDATVDDSSCEEYDTTCPDSTCSSIFSWYEATCSCINVQVDFFCDDYDECTNDYVIETTCECVFEPIENCGEVLGCTDTCAPNYNPDATIDDNSCEDYDTTCPDDTCFFFYNWDAENCSCLESVLIDNVCDDNNECTNDYLDETTCDCLFEPIENCGEVPGCTDACAPNYNPDATVDDSSCEDNDATCPDNTCYHFYTWDEKYCECIVAVIEFYCYSLDECTTAYIDETNCECIYEPIENCGEILGCTDACAPNYNPDATVDDSSCEDYDDTCPDDTCILDYTWSEEDCKCIVSVGEYYCYSYDECTYGYLDETTCDCVFEPIENCGEVLGCTDACSSNYNPDATVNDSSCEDYDTTCDDGDCATTGMYNYESCACDYVDVPETICSHNLCDGGYYEFNPATCECELVEAQVSGCTNPMAENYNANANCDDGSCILPPDNMLPDTIRVCTQPTTPVEICLPSMANETNYEIVDVHSLFYCAIDDLDDANNACFTYTPVPLMELYSPEQLTVTYCDDAQNCFNTIVIVDILVECDPVDCSALLNLCTAPITPIEICIDCLAKGGSITAINDVNSMFDCSLQDLDDDNIGCFVYIPLPGLLNDMLTIEYCLENGCFETTIFVEVSTNCGEGALLVNPDDNSNEQETPTLSNNNNGVYLQNNNTENNQPQTDTQQIESIAGTENFIIPTIEYAENENGVQFNFEDDEQEKFEAINAIEQLAIYPVPATELLMVDIPGKVNSGEINIFNVSGKSMAVKPIENLEDSGQTLQLDVSTYKNGLYYFVLKHGDTITTVTFIKQ